MQAIQVFVNANAHSFFFIFVIKTRKFSYFSYENAFLFSVSTRFKRSQFFLHLFFCSCFIHDATVPCKNDKNRMKKNMKKKLRKRNETNNAFFSFIWNFTYFAHYLMLIFLLNLFNIKIYNYLFKVVRSDLPQRTFLNMKCEWWREEKKFPRIKSKWSEIKIHREKNWNEWIRKKKHRCERA